MTSKWGGPLYIYIYIYIYILTNHIYKLKVKTPQYIRSQHDLSKFGYILDMIVGGKKEKTYVFLATY